jgi:hypothetical protein
MTTSFNTALDRLVVLIETDAPLQNFAMAKWQKRFTVKRKFLKRGPIHNTELPLIMITRPDVEKEFLIGGGRQKKNTVRLYVQFLQDDPEKAQSEVVSVEELLDTCLGETNYRIKDANGIPLVKRVSPGDSANDEGLFHPAYLMVMEIEIEENKPGH